MILYQSVFQKKLMTIIKTDDMFNKLIKLFFIRFIAIMLGKF